MKTLCIIAFIAFVACEKPQQPTLTGSWEGMLYFANGAFPIAMEIEQTGNNLSGIFISHFGSIGGVEISPKSRIEKDSAKIIVSDYEYDLYLYFAGVIEGFERISGSCIITSCGYKYKGAWAINKDHKLPFFLRQSLYPIHKP